MKRVVVSSVVTLLIITLVGIGFYYYNKSPFFKSSPLAAIPPDAPLIFRSKKAGKTFDLLFNNEAWKTLRQTSPGNGFLFVDSLFRKDPETRAAWNELELYVSVHVTKANSYDFLFLMNPPPAFSDGAIEHLVETMSGSPLQKRRYENVTIREVSTTGGNFAFAITKGVFIASFTSFLVEDAIRQMKTGTSIDKSKSFQTAGEHTANSELTCYVNYTGLSSLASNFGSVNAEVISKYLASAASWSVMDANLQSHSVLMNGYSSTVDTSQLASLFLNQFPVENKLSEIVPDRTALLLNFGFSNPEPFFESVRNHPSFFDDTAARQTALARLKRKYGIDIESKMTSWAGHNLALAVTEAGNVNFTNNCFLCIETRSIEDARRKLDALRILINKTSGMPDKQETYRNHTISFLNIPELAPLLYGKSFSRLGKFYYTTIRNYVISGNTASALRSFIDDYEDKKTLSRSDYGKQALQSVTNSHNFFSYLRLPALQNIFRAYFPPQENALAGRGTLGQAFTTFTMSISRQSTGLQTAILWNRLSDDSKGIRLLASAKLDTSIVMRPCIFAVAGEEQKRIAVQDAGNHLYLLDETGEVLWKREMQERILGDIYIVDYFKNGDVQLLYNTPSALHLINLAGEYVGNYPIRFPSSAATGLTVIKNETDGENRIFVYCRNGQVYAYELSGKPFSNWSYSASFNGVNKPILPVTLKGKKYLVLYTQGGELRSLELSGNEAAIWPVKPFAELPGMVKIFADSLGGTFLAGMDSTHHLNILHADGKVTTLDIPTPAPVYDFTFLPDSAGRMHASFITRDSVFAIDENKNRIFSVQLNSLPGAFFQSVAGASRFQSPVVTGAGKIFLIGQDGKTAEGFPIKGSSPIGTWNDVKDGTYNWVTGDADGTIYVYELK